MMRDHAQGHQGYVNGLTGLRGFAAFWVLVYHTWVSADPKLMMLDLGFVNMDLTPLFSAGWAGVDFFFVLSAFLLTMPFARWACGEKAFPKAWPYLVRRFKRVYPAYWAQLLILLVIALTTSLYTFPSWPDLAAHLFMYFHLPPNWVGPMNGVWWTLPTEFLFYLLLLPLALLLKTRATRVVLLSLVFVAWTYRWWVYETFNAQGPGTMVPLMGNTLGSLDEFIIGTYSAYLYIRHQNRTISPLIASLFLWLGISGVLLTVYLIHWLYGIYWEEGHPLLIVKNTVMGISVVSIIIAIVKGSAPAQRLFANPVMLHIGIISYSLYLWHLPVIHTLSKWSFMVNYEGYLLPIMSAFVLPLSWLVSYSSYRWIERPFLQKRT